MTIIKKCTCNSDYQDKKYGKDHRVMNLNQKQSEAKCTVCGKSHKV